MAFLSAYQLRHGNPIASSVCPPFPGYNWNGEMQAVWALPVFEWGPSGQDAFFDAIDDIYFSLYPGAPTIPADYENYPACAPWVETWVRIRKLATRMGKWRKAKKPPVGPTTPPPIRRRRGLKSKGRYRRFARKFGL